MMKLIRQAVSTSSPITLELIDKTHKQDPKYNYLVEIAHNGKSTAASRGFELREDAEEYYDLIRSKGDHLETL